jgi:hypothetical protein
MSVSSGRATRSLLDHAEAKPEREERREEGLLKLVRTRLCWSGARLNGNAIAVARREAQR